MVERERGMQGGGTLCCAEWWGGVQGESVGAAATSGFITGGGHGRSVLEPAWDPPEGVCVCALCAPEAACLCLPVRRVFVDLAREPPSVGVACRGVQVGLGLLPTDVSLMAATWATVTFVLSLKLVKSYILVMVKMCASPVFMLDCANSRGVPGPRCRGQGQGVHVPLWSTERRAVRIRTRGGVRVTDAARAGGRSFRGEASGCSFGIVLGLLLKFPFLGSE